MKHPYFATLAFLVERVNNDLRATGDLRTARTYKDVIKLYFMWTAAEGPIKEKIGDDLRAQAMLVNENQLFAQWADHIVWPAGLKPWLGPNRNLYRYAQEDQDFEQAVRQIINAAAEALEPHDVEEFTRAMQAIVGLIRKVFKYYQTK